MAGHQIERKCPECGTWNTSGEAHCVSCGAVLDPHLRIETEAKQREERRLSVPRGRLDAFVDRFKASRNPFVKALYLVLSALWFVYWVIMSFILWAIAAGPG